MGCIRWAWAHIWQCWWELWWGETGSAGLILRRRSHFWSLWSFCLPHPKKRKHFGSVFGRAAFNHASWSAYLGHVASLTAVNVWHCSNCPCHGDDRNADLFEGTDGSLSDRMSSMIRASFSWPTMKSAHYLSQGGDVSFEQQHELMQTQLFWSLYGVEAELVPECLAASTLVG